MPRKTKDKINLSLPAPINPRDKSIFEESDFSTTVTGTETLQPASTTLVVEGKVSSTPEPVYSVMDNIKEKKALPGVTVGTDIPSEPLTDLEDEIFRIFHSDAKVYSEKGISAKLKGKYEQATADEIRLAIANLMAEGHIVEVSDGKYQIAQADYEDEGTPTPGPKRKTGKAGKTFRNLFAKTKMSGSGFMGKVGKGGRKIGVGVGSVGASVGSVGASVGKGVGAKTPFVGTEARETRAEESSFWENQYRAEGIDNLPPSMRKGARKGFKTGYKDEQKTASEVRQAGIDPFTVEREQIWDEKKKRMIPGPNFIRVRKSPARIKQDLLDHQIAVEHKGAELNIGKSLHRRSKGLNPGKVRSTLQTAGKVAVVGSKGGMALAKQFGNAPRLSNVGGHTGYDSPITYEGSGAGRLRAATVGFRPLGISSPRSGGSGGNAMDPFPSRDRISPAGKRIPLFSTPGTGGRVTSASRRGPGRARSRPLF